MTSSLTIKCSDCGEPLTEEMKECPKCGSKKRVIRREFIEKMGGSDSLGIKKRSGEKDERGKPIKEERRRVKGNTQTKITIDRSKRLNGIPETEVTHEVTKNGKTVHGPHQEPKGKRNKKERDV